MACEYAPLSFLTTMSHKAIHDGFVKKNKSQFILVFFLQGKLQDIYGFLQFLR